MTRPVKSAQQANQNWASAMAQPLTQQKFTQGVQAVTESPNAKAAAPAAVAKYANATSAAVSSGRMAAANNAVPLDKWKTATAAGAQRLATGAAAKKQKQLDAGMKLQGGWQAMRDAAAAIPHDGSIASASAKVTAAMQAMRAHVGKPTS